MRAARVGKGVGWLGAVVVLLGSVACGKKHSDFPAQIDVSEPQMVTNLLVDNPSGFDYDLTWDIADPGAVAWYRIYASFDGETFALAVDSIPSTSAMVASFAPVAVFGVTVVSDAYVEGAMRTGAP